VIMDLDLITKRTQYTAMSTEATELPHPKPSDAPVLNAHSAIPAENKIETRINTRWKALSDIDQCVE